MGWGGIGGFLGDTFGGFADAFGGLSDAFGGLSDAFSQAFNPIENAFNDAGGDVSDAFKHTVEVTGSTIYDNRGLLTSVALGVLTGGVLSPYIGLMVGGGVAGVLGADKNLSNDLYDVVTGRYADDQKKVENNQKTYNDKVAEYDMVMNDLLGRYVIPEEIFQIAAASNAGRVQSNYMTQLDYLKAVLDQNLRHFDQEYSSFQALLDNKYLKYFGWVPLVVGGFVSDVRTFIETGDFEAARRALNVVVQVIGIVISVIITIVTWGTSSALTVPAIVAMITALIGQVITLAMTLDSMYGKGLLMNGAFATLDFLLNEILQLDNLASDLDTHKLSDVKYYEELTGYVQMINSIVGIVASVVAVYTAPSSGVSNAAGKAMSESYPLIASAISVTSSNTYRVIMTAFSAYSLYGDVQKAEDALEALKTKAKNDIDRINNKIETNRKRKVMESYKAVEQMLTGTSNIISEYAMSAFASPTSTFDPEMTIAANYGYEYTGDNVMNFIPEYTINYDKLAGGSTYTNDILYKTAI